MVANGTPKPHWSPIERLELPAHYIDGMLASSQEQYENLQQARPKPYILRRNSGKLTLPQQQEIERLVGQMKRLQEVIEAILALADELKAGTIEKQLSKSDVDYIG